MNLEDFIKDLDPELQEKARACGSVEELLALAKEAKVPVPDEALAAVAGGDSSESVSCKKTKCPKCGSTNLTARPASKWDDTIIWTCRHCHYQWET